MTLLGVRTLVAFAAVTTFTLPAAGQGFPGANGKPFQALQSEIVGLQKQIDATNTQVAQLGNAIATLQGSLAAAQSDLASALAQIANIQTQAGTTAAQIAALQADALVAKNRVAALQGQLDSLTAQQIFLSSQIDALQAFRYGVASNTCPVGSSIRGIGLTGSTVCEIDTGHEINLLFTSRSVSPNFGTPVDLFCPAGQRFVSGGFSYQFGITVSAALPLGNGYSIQVFNSADAPRSATVLVNCSPL